MQYRRFGRTEIQMPVFSCGGMRYQYQWTDCPLDSIPPENQANLEATIRRSLELGIQHIETARGYGSSERQLGVLLPTLPREELIVQTKIAPCSDAKQFRSEFEDSLARLNLAYVDLLALHGINRYEHLWWATRKGGCLQVARELVKEGKVRHVGFSTHGDPELIEDTVRHDRDGGFDYVNLHWYYIYQRNWAAIELATAADMGVFIISPADKGGMLYRPPDRLRALCGPLHPLVFNCLFCLSRPEIHTLSLGASCPSDFDLQCSALDDFENSLTRLPEIIERLDAALIASLGEDVYEGYYQGLPGWEDAPGYRNVRVVLWLRHLVRAFDLKEYAKMRYNLLGNGGHWFSGLNAEGAGGLDGKEVFKDHAFAERLPQWLEETHQMLRADPEKRLSNS